MPKLTYENNYLIAKQICDELNTKVKSSHDIISRKKMPFFYTDEILRYVNQFGDKAVSDYCAHTNDVRIMRRFLSELAQLDKMITTPRNAADLALTQLGYGECGELSLLALTKLIERNQFGCMVTLANTVTRDPNQRNYLHRIVMLGSSSPREVSSKNYIQAFESLPDDVVVIDPLMHHVGKANTYLTDQAEYLNHFQYNRICSVENAGENHVRDLPRAIEDANRMVSATVLAAVSIFKKKHAKGLDSTSSNNHINNTQLNVK